MGTNFLLLPFLISLSLFVQFSGAETPRLYSSRLVHRFSAEAVSFWAGKGRNATPPERGSSEHTRALLGIDYKRQRLKVGSHNQLLVPSQGSQTFFYGNDMGWLHYTWIDIGTPNTSFLAALDAGSDLLWVPCGCVKCAPLSSSYYSALDIDLNEYNPSKSSTSKHLSCGHQLCQLSSKCQSPKDQCPYVVNYYTEDTSSSGFLFEDQLHLTSVGGANESTLKVPVIVGCGSKQSGSYLDGVAPDGLMGLGPGEISVPSLLAKSGLVPHSFSFCFDDSYSGRIYFGDQGPVNQRTTPFIPIQGEYAGYFVKVEGYCFGSVCLKESAFQAQVDSGSSFTYLPQEAYKMVVAEFDKRVNATRSGTDNFPYCYRASSHGEPDIPGMKFIFAMNQSFAIESPMFRYASSEGADLYCLGVLPMDGDIGIIGQNFMMGYRLVFDWENLKLGWSHSNCQDISEGHSGHGTSPPDSSFSPLPAIEQQRGPQGRAVAPAVAGRTPTKRSSASTCILNRCSKTILLVLVLTTLRLPCSF